MNVLETYETDAWDARFGPAAAERATQSLENGRVLYFPRLPFMLTEAERRFLSRDCSDGKAKNISLDPGSGILQGTRLEGQDRHDLAAMVGRFARQARAFIEALLPGYGGFLEQARTSYRPLEVEGRVSSYKKDDTRLHVDAFASRPNQGKRILRLFTNINPHGKPRVWNVGEPFESFAPRFLDRIPRPWPGSAWLLEHTGITKGRRSLYDHLMLQLHDRGKHDLQYQRNAEKHRIEFPPGSTWVVFTDRTLHAALSGQYLLEQTFHLPVSAMQDPARSPLRILEGLRNTALA